MGCFPKATERVAGRLRLLLNAPADWSHTAEAAAISAVFMTAYYALT